MTALLTFPIDAIRTQLPKLTSMLYPREFLRGLACLLCTVQIFTMYTEGRAFYYNSACELFLGKSRKTMAYWYERLGLSVVAR